MRTGVSVLLVLLMMMMMMSFSAIGLTHEQGLDEKKSHTLTHVVLLWLKDPGNVQAISQIKKISHSFADIPGVLSVQVGSAVASERPIVDDSFDVGIIVTLANQQAMDVYLKHPVHQQAVHDIIKPLVQKIIVYDID